MNSYSILRPNFIDYTKSIGIWLVILGHFVYYFNVPFSSSPVWWLCHSITLFHMPLFFIISGMLMKDSSFDVIGRRIIKRLLIPYVLICGLCSFIGFGMMMLRDDFDVSISIYLHQLLAVLTAGDFNDNDRFSAPMWYCVALAWIQIFFSVLGLKARICAVMVGIVIMHMGNFFPFRLDSAMVGYIFFVIGFYLRPYIYNIADLNCRKQLFVLLLVSILLIISAYINLDYGQKQCLSINAMCYGNYPILFLVSGISGTIVIMLVSVLMARWRFFSPFVFTISSGTIIILGFHKTIAILMKDIITAFSVPIALLYSIMCLLICYVLIIIFKRYIPIIMGGR